MYDLSTVHPTVRKFGQHKSGSTEAASAFKSPVDKTIYVDRLKHLARSLRNLFISQTGIAFKVGHDQIFRLECSVFRLVEKGEKTISLGTSNCLWGLYGTS